jgi:hypothetical protein
LAHNSPCGDLTKARFADKRIIDFAQSMVNKSRMR